MCLLPQVRETTGAQQKQSPYYEELVKAQEAAQGAGLGLWNKVRRMCRNCALQAGTAVAGVSGGAAGMWPAGTAVAGTLLLTGSSSGRLMRHDSPMHRPKDLQQRCCCGAGSSSMCCRLLMCYLSLVYCCHPTPSTILRHIRTCCCGLSWPADLSTLLLMLAGLCRHCCHAGAYPHLG